MRSRKNITLTAAVLLVLALSQSSKTTSRVARRRAANAVFLGASEHSLIFIHRGP